VFRFPAKVVDFFSVSHNSLMVVKRWQLVTATSQGVLHDHILLQLLQILLIIIFY